MRIKKNLKRNLLLFSGSLTLIILSATLTQQISYENINSDNMISSYLNSNMNNVNHKINWNPTWANLSMNNKVVSSAQNTSFLSIPSGIQNLVFGNSNQLIASQYAENFNDALDRSTNKYVQVVRDTLVSALFPDSLYSSSSNNSNIYSQTNVNQYAPYITNLSLVYTQSQITSLLENINYTNITNWFTTIPTATVLNSLNLTTTQKEGSAYQLLVTLANAGLSPADICANNSAGSFYVSATFSQINPQSFTAANGFYLLNTGVAANHNGSSYTYLVRINTNNVLFNFQPKINTNINNYLNNPTKILTGLYNQSTFNTLISSNNSLMTLVNDFTLSNDLGNSLNPLNIKITETNGKYYLSWEYAAVYTNEDLNTNPFLKQVLSNFDLENQISANIQLGASLQSIGAEVNGNIVTVPLSELVSNVSESWLGTSFSASSSFWPQTGTLLGNVGYGANSNLEAILLSDYGITINWPTTMNFNVINKIVLSNANPIKGTIEISLDANGIESYISNIKGLKNLNNFGINVIKNTNVKAQNITINNDGNIDIFTNSLEKAGIDITPTYLNDIKSISIIDANQITGTAQIIINWNNNVNNDSQNFGVVSGFSKIPVSKNDTQVSNTQNLWWIAIVVIVPLLFLAIGLWYWWFKRNKK